MQIQDLRAGVPETLRLDLLHLLLRLLLHLLACILLAPLCCKGVLPLRLDHHGPV